MRPAPPRVIAVAMAATLAMSSLASAAIAVVSPPELGLVEINGGVPWTNQAIVTVATPATNAVSMRLSNDGLTWKTMAWAPSTSWDLTDPTFGGTSTQGQKEVSVEVDDGTDSWGPWDSGGGHVLYDTQGPEESQLRVSFEPGRQVTSGGLVTMAVTWFNNDHQQSGTLSYDVETRIDGGAWTPNTTHPAIPGYLQAFSTVHTYQVRVRGHDNATNVGSWYEGSPFKATAYQESSTKLTWTGAWPRATVASYWGGHAKASQTIGAKARITVSGRSIALVSRVGPTRGYVVIYVNGSQVATVGLRASTSAYRRVVWTKWYPTSATRTVTFRIMGVPGPDWVDIDAVLSGS